MQPWVLIEKANTPDGTPLELLQRGSEFAIRAAGQALMSSRAHGSEASLAELGVAAIAERQKPRVLVGGLGCGYTLAAALEHLPPAAEVVVVEISAHVVAWNRNVIGHLARHPLGDSRVLVCERDVIDELHGAQATFDLILLDVDNGPAALTQARNAWLYQERGLAQLRAALRPGGALCVWSAGPDSAFTACLRRMRFAVAEHRVQARAGRGGSRHTIWVGTRAR